MRLSIAVMLALFLIQQPAEVPTPFGLQMGMTKDQLKIDKEVDRYKFQLSSVSRRHTDLDTYIVTVTPKAGLCFIRALSPDWKTNSDGAVLKSRFASMKTQVEDIYGKPVLLDSLQPESKLDKPNEWMAALQKRERTLLARWSVDDGLPMKPTIMKIYVASYAASTEAGYLAVEYYFTNYEQCQAEVNAPNL
jgi:hypothetical protein